MRPARAPVAVAAAGPGSRRGALKSAVSERFDPATRRRVAENRRNWDARARVHADSPHYSLSERAADTRFHPREWEQLGPLDGRSVLHLQCHNGAETLAFAQKGARTTGLDFSGGSLAAARRGARAAGVSVDFVEADVYDAVTALDGRTFDLVYTGRGSLPYLPDLDEWAHVVARLLEPGGLVHRSPVRRGRLTAWEEAGRHAPVREDGTLPARYRPVLVQPTSSAVVTRRFLPPCLPAVTSRSPRGNGGWCRVAAADGGGGIGRRRRPDAGRCDSRERPAGRRGDHAAGDAGRRSSAGRGTTRPRRFAERR